MNILHIIPGLNEPTCGIAVAAKMVAGQQERDGASVKCVDFRKWKWRDVRAADEVWVHSMWTASVIMAAIAAVISRRRLVRMPHGCLDPVRLRYHGWKKWLVGPIERWALRRAERVVATCEAEAEWIRAYEPRVKRVEAVDIKRFFDFGRAGRVEYAEGRPLHVLYLGRRHPLKGVEYLERAVNREGRIELRIVSDAFGEKKEKVWEWCDVLVLPTLSENFGLVVAEALERGKRVITTDGAPAWSDGNDYGGRLTYLRGFREGTDEERVALLKEALLAVM